MARSNIALEKLGKEDEGANHNIDRSGLMEAVKCNILEPFRARLR